MQLIFFLQLFTLTAFAGDEIKAGTVLKQDSYVFSIEEAEKLKSRIEDLEKKEQLLEQYKKLDTLRVDQNNMLSLILKLKDDQISSYKEIIDEKDKQILLIEKTNNKKEIKTYALFGAGILFAGLSIYAADRFDDSMER